MALNNSQAPSELLQLPSAVLQSVLQQLDQCSLFSAAACCTTIKHAAAAVINSLEVRCRTAETFNNLTSWLQQNSASQQITQCRIYDNSWALYHTGSAHGLVFTIATLACPQLRELHLQHLNVQLEPSDSWPGVLHDCTGLTALHLQQCGTEDFPAAFAAIAALPDLCCLQLEGFSDGRGTWPFPRFQNPSKLTQLTLTEGGSFRGIAEISDQVGQLSALVNLEILRLHDMPCSGIPGGFPSQLSKLTYLDVWYSAPCDLAEQFKHLSSLTALQELEVNCRSPPDDPTSADSAAAFLLQVLRLSQLTRLQLPGWSSIDFRNSSTHKWSSMTALQSLNLSDCTVQPDALAAMTQLRTLSLDSVTSQVGHVAVSPFEELVAAVSKMLLLTALCWCRPRADPTDMDNISHLTALTASTNLCSLHLGDWRNFLECRAPGGCVLFEQGTVYPQLRDATLHAVFPYDATPVSQQQLQQLPSCCPAVESLSVELWLDPAAADCQVLLQLPALTKLELGIPGFSAAWLDVVVQLTGLKSLRLDGLPDVAHPTLLPLTALTALEHLCLGSYYFVTWVNQACRGEPPNVWVQLQRYLPDLLPVDQLYEAYQQEKLVAAAAGSLAAMHLPDQQQA